ncbi:protein O-mannosyl-transferase 2 [Elysia marginata]|uniref:Protein O-mannosyl-transferase 2 n=1 Tax=Elysia marginata TaxID=1093978 RepID=A0AAV4E9F0_9GAST|nr:protein O-mannosyl-transferase 2 [Elysia marginata]
MFSGPAHRVYLLGNPILFWSLLGLKFTFLLLWLGFSVCNKRGIIFNKLFSTYTDRVMKVCWWLLWAWFLHYAPFWTMGRVLYFHHYFPAFLFSAMFGGVMLDFLLTLVCLSVPSRLARHVFTGGLTLILAVMALSFYLFYPLVYGMSGSTSGDKDSIMYGLKWLESWDF